MGGVLVGLLCVAWELVAWYPGLKRLRSKGVAEAGRLLPFVLSWSTGCLVVMLTGGVVGWIGDKALWGMNAFGDAVLIYGVGSQAGTAPGTSSQPLTQGGIFVTAIIITGFIASLVARGGSGSQVRGVVAGIGMGLSAGVARYAAVPIASAVNVLGVWLTGMLS